MDTMLNATPIQVFATPPEEQSPGQGDGSSQPVQGGLAGFDPFGGLGNAAFTTPLPNRPDDKAIASYVQGWRTKLREGRLDKLTVWDECWRMYRGLEDWGDKDEWQSKIFLPKSWAAVEQATSLIIRLLQANTDPWQHEAVNPDDLVTAYRARQMTDLTKVFLEKARYIDAFREALKTSFIMGVGILKVWWGLENRERIRTQLVQGEGPDGEPAPQMQTIWEQLQEGRLFVQAVDPYKFYWLPGSKFNQWVGTLEEIEVPKWELQRMADEGIFDPELVKQIQPQRVDDAYRKSYMRFNERNRNEAPTQDTMAVKLTEFYGPIVINGQIIEEKGHVIMANDSIVLKIGKNNYWTRKPPYVGFSPTTMPFRTEGFGIIENVKELNKSLNKLANLSVDTLMYRLLPVFEVTPEVYENPEDFQTGLTPGKIFRRNQAYSQDIGIRPIGFEDISGGAVQVQAQLDRAYQEGALVSEIQQAIPRYRGVQTATELELKQANQDSFFGAMAAAIEENAIKPLVELAGDMLCQFLYTSGDQRIEKILGVGAGSLASMSREQLLELIQGDYVVKVGGLVEQLEKTNMLQNLVQLMNIIGQNGQAWMPYINQDALLRRVLEAFSPSIRDIDSIIADPATAQARAAALASEQSQAAMLGMVPQLIQAQQQQQQAQVDTGLQLQQMELQKQELQLQQAQMMMQMQAQLAQQQEAAQQGQQGQAPPQQQGAQQ